jgi:hypothetical protein
MSTARCASASALRHLHATFLAMVPRIVTHGQVYFRHLKCPLQREDAIAEMVALTWMWHVRLTERGKDTSRFVSALATYAARSVQSGGRLTGMERPKEVLSPWAQRVHGFEVQKLPDHSTLSRTPFAEALQDNTQTPVPDQVAFRCDYPPWRASHTERDRRIIDALMLGERTSVVAARHGLSASRISQMRHELHQDWQRFCGEDEEGRILYEA